MTSSSPAVDAYWAAARRRVGPATLVEVAGEHAAGAQPPPAWSFGASAADADELLALVLAGTKTGTAGALASYQAEGEPVPRAGDLSIILDGQGEPRALIVTTEVSLCPFDEVGAEHAAAEGEGDRSRAHWRAVHWRFFTDELAKVGQEFTESSAVVLERFRLLDPATAPVRSSAARLPTM